MKDHLGRLHVTLCRNIEVDGCSFSADALRHGDGLIHAANHRQLLLQRLLMMRGRCQFHLSKLAAAWVYLENNFEENFREVCPCDGWRCPTPSSAISRKRSIL